MADVHAIDAILSVRNVLVVIASLFALVIFRMWAGLPAVMAAWNEGWLTRRRAQATEKEEERERYYAEIKRLDTRCDVLADKVQECETREEQWRQRALGAEERAIVAEAALQGQGVVRQSAAMAAAEVRLAAKDAERKGEGK